VSNPILRSFRVLRAVRLIPKIKEMRNLVTALIGATRKIFAVGMLLLLIFYVFAVSFTLVFKDLYEDGYTAEDYFSRLDKTFFTLFQLMTLDSWSYITKQVMVVFPWSWFPIMTFIMVSSFVVINLVIAVICDAVSEVQRIEIEETVQQINSMVSTVSKKQGYARDMDIAMLENKIDDLQQIIQELRAEMKSQKKDEKMKDLTYCNCNIGLIYILEQ